MRNDIIEVKKENKNIIEEISGGAVVRAHKDIFGDMFSVDTDVIVAEMPVISVENHAAVEIPMVEMAASQVIEIGTASAAASAKNIVSLADASNIVVIESASAGLARTATTTLTASSDVLVVSQSSSSKAYNTGAGADIVQLQGSYNTVHGEAGNDILKIGMTSGNGHTLYGDAGNDILIVSGGTGHTLVGGSGNDSYVINALTKNGTYTINQNDAGSADRDSLNLSKFHSKEFTCTLKNDNDLVLNHTSGAQITIQGWKKNSLTDIKFNDGTVAGATINASVKPAAPTTAIGVIQSFMASLDVTVQKGFTAVDEAVAACSNGLYSNLTSLVNSFINDCLKHSGSSVAERKAFLQQYCGINLDNADTGAITGSDAGGKVTKTAESIVKESVGINGFTYNYNNFKTVQAVDLSGFVTGKSTSYSTTKSFYGVTINGVTLYWNESNWGELGINTNVIRQVVGGIINTWVKDGLNLIEESYGLTLNNPNSTLQRLSDGTVGLQLYFTNSTTNTAIASINSSRYYSGNITTKTFELMNVNLNYYMNGCGNENGASSKSGAGYLDRTIAHELTHAVMAANINSHGSLPVFIKEGMSELTHGIDDQRVNSILNLVNTAQSGGLEAFLRKTFNLTSTSATNSTYTYAGGYALLRYLAKQVADASGKMENSMSYSLGDLLDTSSYDSYIGFNMSEVMSQTQDAMASFADSTVDFGSALDIASYSTNKDTMVYGNC